MSIGHFPVYRRSSSLNERDSLLPFDPHLSVSLINNRFRELNFKHPGIPSQPTFAVDVIRSLRVFHSSASILTGI